MLLQRVSCFNIKGKKKEQKGTKIIACFEMKVKVVDKKRGRLDSSTLSWDVDVANPLQIWIRHPPNRAGGLFVCLFQIF